MRHEWTGVVRERLEDYRATLRTRGLWEVSIGAATLLAGVPFVMSRWDVHTLGVVRSPLFFVLLFGGSMLAMGSGYLLMSERFMTWMTFPMRKEWGQGLGATWDALAGYLAAQGVGSRRLRSWDRSTVTLQLDGGLRVAMSVVPRKDAGPVGSDIFVTILRINRRNEELAERVQGLLDGWPLLEELSAGVDKSIYEEPTG